MNNEWKESKLSDIANITMGQSPKGETCNSDGLGHPLLNGPTEFGNKYPFPVQFTTNPIKQSEIGDILFCVRGSTTGRMNWADQKYVIGRGLASIRHKNGIDYQHFIKGILDVSLPSLLAITTGSTFPNISRGQLENLSINLPPLPEQKRIAEILSSLDDKIELNNIMNKNLEEMAQAIFKQWFVDFEFPDENGNPYKSSGGKMIQSELGEIPERWSVKELGDICEIGSGKRPGKKQDLLDSEFTIPLVGATKIMGYTKEILYDEPLLIIGRVGTHGVIQKYNEPIWASDNTLVIKAKYYEFTYQILNSIDYGSLNRGSTQPLITQTDIKNTKIIFSNAILLVKFENVVKYINDKVIKNKGENESLTKTRDSLLPRLMSGELRV